MNFNSKLAKLKTKGLDIRVGVGFFTSSGIFQKVNEIFLKSLKNVAEISKVPF